MAQRQTYLNIQKTLHSARLSSYISASQNHLPKALELYRWNLRLAGAFQEVLSVTEIALRNAMDDALRVWNSAQPHHSGSGHHSPEWLLDPAKPLNGLTKIPRATAQKQAQSARAARHNNHPRKNAPINHDDLLAQLTFGVFAKLLPTSDSSDKNYTAKRVLWQQALHGAFPHSQADPDGYTLADRVGRLHALRNRVSHMEPLLTVNVTARHNDALRTIAAIDPSTRDWCAGMSRIKEVASSRP